MNKPKFLILFLLAFATVAAGAQEEAGVTARPMGEVQEVTPEEAAGVTARPMDEVQEVTPEEAAGVAARLLLGEATKASALELVRVEDVSADDGALYIFNQNDGKGFAIVSGSKKIHPIIAYSKESSLDTGDLPPNLRELLEQYRSCINDLQKDGVATVHPSWSAGVATKADAVVLHKTAVWDQRKPYNDKCPIINDKQCLTGCTGVAMAILMRFFEHPEKGIGSTDEYSYKNESKETVTMPSVSLEQPFNWNKMPINESRPWTEEHKDEVSRFIYLCALMCRSEFGTSETPGYYFSGHRAIQMKMDYDLSSLFHYRNWYSDGQWSEVLCDNLTNIGPVLYSARDEHNSGHAFVVDGFDSEGLFHINWGWGGSDNGYFALPDFLTYKFNHIACIGFRPNQGGEAVQLLSLYASENYSGISLYNNVTVTENIPFAIKCGLVHNESVNTPFNGCIKAVTIDRQGNVKEDISGEKLVSLNSGSSLYYSIDCLVTKTLEVGDRITLYYKNDRDGIWRQILFDRSTVTGELPIYDSVTIEESTSISYSVADARLTVGMKPGVSYSFSLDGAGGVSSGGASSSGGVSSFSGLSSSDASSISGISSFSGVSSGGLSSSGLSASDASSISGVSSFSGVSSGGASTSGGVSSFSGGASSISGISAEGEGPLTIDTSSLPGGTYTLHMEKKNESVKLKIKIKGKQK